MAALYAKYLFGPLSRKNNKLKQMTIEEKVLSWWMENMLSLRAQMFFVAVFI